MTRSNASVNVRQASQDVYIIDLAGDLTSSADAALLQAYNQVSSQGARVVILNFSHLDYKNSSGTKLLLILLTRGKATGQRVLAVGLSAQYQAIFQVTQLDREIAIYSSEASDTISTLNRTQKIHYIT